VEFVEFVRFVRFMEFVRFAESVESSQSLMPEPSARVAPALRAGCCRGPFTRSGRLG
jgi:hypothetical protein